MNQDKRHVVIQVRPYIYKVRAPKNTDQPWRTIMRRLKITTEDGHTTVRELSPDPVHMCKHQSWGECLRCVGWMYEDGAIPGPTEYEA